jgi:NTE family protein
VFPTEGLRKAVASYLRFDRLEDAPVPFVVVATRLEDGCEEWFTEGPAIEAVLASAALPGMYPVVEIGGAHYLDGGIIDNVAISAALAAGAKRIIVLLCGNVDSPAPTFQRPFEAMFAAFGLALQSRVRRDLASVPADVDVVVIEQAGTMIFDPQDFSRVDELIDRGYRAARDVLDDYAAACAERKPQIRPRWWRSRPDRLSSPSPELPQSVSRSGLPLLSPPSDGDRPAASASTSDTAAAAVEDVPPGSTR